MSMSELQPIKKEQRLLDSLALGAVKLLPAPNQVRHIPEFVFPNSESYNSLTQNDTMNYSNSQRNWSAWLFTRPATISSPLNEYF